MTLPRMARQEYNSQFTQLVVLPPPWVSALKASTTAHNEPVQFNKRNNGSTSPWAVKSLSYHPVYFLWIITNDIL